jgi:DNA-binding CsgD family transcriptional regulator
MRFTQPSVGAGEGPAGVVGALDAACWSVLSARLRLSGRECEIAQGVVEDLKEFAIALKLGVSPHTVRTHLERMYRKLGVNSRVELVVLIYNTRMAMSREPGSGIGPICARRDAGQCPFVQADA